MQAVQSALLALLVYNIACASHLEGEATLCMYIQQLQLSAGAPELFVRLRLTVKGSETVWAWVCPVVL